VCIEGASSETLNAELGRLQGISPEESDPELVVLTLLAASSDASICPNLEFNGGTLPASSQEQVDTECMQSTIDALVTQVIGPDYWREFDELLQECYSSATIPASTD
jgi:hypothetical protein